MELHSPERLYGLALQGQRCQVYSHKCKFFFCDSNSSELLLNSSKDLNHLLPANLQHLRSVFPCRDCFPYALYELFSTRSCLQEFETRPNPISRTALVPIGILVSSTAPTKPRSHRGLVCVLCSQVNHLSNMPATRLKLTEQDRIGDMHSEGD